MREKRDIHSLSLLLMVGLLLLVLVAPIGLLALTVWASSFGNWGLVVAGLGVALSLAGMRFKAESLPAELIPSIGLLLSLGGVFGWILSFGE